MANLRVSFEDQVNKFVSDFHKMSSRGQNAVKAAISGSAAENGVAPKKRGRPAKVTAPVETAKVSVARGRVANGSKTAKAAKTAVPAKRGRRAAAPVSAVMARKVKLGRRRATAPVLA